MASPSDSLSETESCNDQDIWGGHDDDANFDGPTQRRRARKKRKRDNSGPTTRTTLGSLYASVDCEDVDFDSIAKSVLDQCVKTRDELGELHERDDLGRPYLLISPSDEADLLEMLEARSRSGLSVAEAIILRKLKLQRHMRTHNLSPPVLRPKIPSALIELVPACKPPEPDSDVLRALYGVQTTPYNSSSFKNLSPLSHT
ncbi:hypothetical protein EDB89DRAFT_940903 [Lactarius sanguifluus]|nr:hypothetical protein EDB89DRAFT_940903 [Lactarius sanguifluus]